MIGRSLLSALAILLFLSPSLLAQSEFSFEEEEVRNAIAEEFEPQQAYIKVERNKVVRYREAEREIIEKHFRAYIEEGSVTSPDEVTMKKLEFLVNHGLLRSERQTVEVSRDDPLRFGETKTVEYQFAFFDLTDIGRDQLEEAVAYSFMSGTSDGFPVGRYEFAGVARVSDPIPVENTFGLRAIINVRFVATEDWYVDAQNALPDLPDDEALPDESVLEERRVELLRVAEGWRVQIEGQ